VSAADVRDGELVGYLFGRETENDSWSRHHDDVDAALRIGSEIAEMQARAPSFSPLVLDSRAAWIETLEADDVTYFVAERNGAPVGRATLHPPGPDRLASRFWPARGFRPTFVRVNRAPGIA
jgi:hypothetical protein